MSTRSSWIPAESVVLLSDRDLNSRPVEQKRYTGYVAWQVIGGVTRAANADLIALIMRFEPPDLLVIRSRDQGRTWLKPQPVWRNERANDFSAAAVGAICLSSGRLLAIMRGEVRNEIEVARPPSWSLYSDDHGTSWKPSAPIKQQHPFQGMFPWGLFEHDRIVYSMVEGKLLDQPADGRSTIGPWGVGLVGSRDFGETWDSPRVLLRPDPVTGIEPTEHQIVQMTANRWLMLVRPRPVDIATITVSEDAGRTWSRQRPVLADSANHRLARLPDGSVILAGRGPYGVRYLVSHDECKTWAYEGILEGAGDVCGGIVTIDERTVFLVYGSATGRPYSTATGAYNPGYFFSGLRGRFLRKQG